MNYRDAVEAMHRLELLRRIQARALMSDSGLHPGQPPLLKYIWDHPGCTQKEAADELDVTPASAAASLKRLEKAGFVLRRTDEKDTRRNRLFITDTGRTRMEENGRQFGLLDERMFRGMDEGEVEAFRRACEKMFDNLADENCRHLTIWKLAQQARRDEEGKDA
ncbi:MAG: winged helix-turn-helix transcriptional regulator [Clostridia bacterium]|nr:winged helix-turn-helix transcriptional regulator [Clostridia bacterium]